MFFLPLLLLPSVVLSQNLSAPLVQSNQLRRVLTRTALLAHGRELENHAAAGGGHRAFGSTGHNLTVDYIVSKLEATGYWDVEIQTFSHLFSEGASSFTAGNLTYLTEWMTYGPGGNVSGAVVNVANLGCSPEDYPVSVVGNIALIKRGTCEFGLKIAYAGAAGAVGAIIYNNAPGMINGGTLSQPSRPEGPYVPMGSISGEDGSALAALLVTQNITGSIRSDAITEERPSSNVIATTKGGDKGNLIFAGAHTDSVPEGPGINDNGSGAIGLLEIALQLPKWSVNNAVRLGFWTAEEYGLVGSDYYVTSLSPEELYKIRLYLNVDMIASPNFGYFVYDGDGSAYNITGPPGSDLIEKLYEDYFREVGLGSLPTAFTGRSDYGAFLDAGIPSGGLFTGAEQLKTPEEAYLWGGKAGVAYDINYHLSGDTLQNCNVGAWIQNTKALAHSIATYARDVTEIPIPAARNSVKIPKSHAHMKGVKCGVQNTITA